MTETPLDDEEAIVDPFTQHVGDWLPDHDYAAAAELLCTDMATLTAADHKASFEALFIDELPPKASV